MNDPVIDGFEQINQARNVDKDSEGGAGWVREFLGFDSVPSEKLSFGKITKPRSREVSRDKFEKNKVLARLYTHLQRDAFVRRQREHPVVIHN